MAAVTSRANDGLAPGKRVTGLAVIDVSNKLRCRRLCKQKEIKVKRILLNHAKTYGCK